LFLSVGGDVGKLVAMENISREDRDAKANTFYWATEDDLLEQYHQKRHVVADVIKQCEKSKDRVRQHPDFAHLPEMKQYKVLSKSLETTSTTTSHSRSLHWSANLTGQVALDVANNLDELFEMDFNGMCGRGESSTAVPAPAAKSKGKKNTKTPKGDAKPRKPPADPLAVYTTSLRGKCMEFVVVLREVRAGLAAHTWTAGLVSMIDAEVSFFESQHDKFAAMLHAELVRAAVDAEAATYREHAAKAVDFVRTADNMLGNKKRKVPAEPVAPPEPAAVPAAESSASVA
jgi:hypothetical protein